MTPQLQNEIKALLILNGIEPNSKASLQNNIASLVEKYSNPEKAVSLLRPNLLKGKESKPCPLCEQTVKVYLRSITPAMAYCLIRAYRHNQHGLVDIPSLFRDNHAVQSDFTKLKFWELVEQDKTVRRAGLWKLTDKGRRFVENQLSVQKYAKVYNDTFRGFDGDAENIIMCLDGKYNYTHLMNSPIDKI